MGEAREKARIAKARHFSHQLQYALGAYAIGVWRLEGGTANDESGYNQNLTIINSAQIDSLSGLGDALYFNGSDAYLEYGDNEVLNPEYITFELWAKSDIPGQDYSVNGYILNRYSIRLSNSIS